MFEIHSPFAIPDSKSVTSPIMQYDVTSCGVSGSNKKKMADFFEGVQNEVKMQQNSSVLMVSKTLLLIRINRLTLFLCL